MKAAPVFHVVLVWSAHGRGEHVAAADTESSMLELAYCEFSVAWFGFQCSDDTVYAVEMG